MYDWTDDFAIQAIQSFPHLRFYIWQALDMGDIEPMLNLLLSHERGGNV